MPVPPLRGEALSFPAQCCVVTLHYCKPLECLA